MFSKITLALLVALLVVQPVSAQETSEEETAAALAAVRNAMAKINSYSMKISMSMQMMNQQMEISGDMIFLKPDLMKMNMDMPGMQGGKMKMVMDEETAWIHMPMMNMVQKIDKTVFKEIGNVGNMQMPMMGSNDPLDQLDKETIELIGSEQCDGQSCYVFEGTVEPTARKIAGPMSPHRMRVWMAKSDGLTRKMKAFGEGGQQMMEIVATEVDKSVEVTRADFQFTPPEGAQVIDLTDQMRALFEKMKEQAEPTPAPTVEADI